MRLVAEYEDMQSMDHLGSQAPRPTPGPRAGPQKIMSLLHLDVHMLPPNQPRIQEYSQILDRHGAAKGNSKTMGFDETSKFHFLCKNYE